MKLVFFTMLALNLGYFLVQYFVQDEIRPASTASVTGKAQGLVLLSETQEDVKSLAMNSVVANPVEDRSEREGQSGTDCYGIGPFADVFSGQNTLEQLGAIGVEALLQAVDAPTGESDYRVMIPPASSAEEAFRKLRELQANDIDSYVITQGEQTLGISLGVFSTIVGAEALQAELVERGYGVQNVEIERKNRSYWILLEVAQFGLLKDSGWLAQQQSIGSQKMNCAES